MPTPGSILVRNRIIGLDSRPLAYATAQRAIIDTRNGKQCCCGVPPPCPNPCTADDGVCTYCPNDSLQLFSAEYAQEDWGPSAGGRQFPPCDNQQNACPGKPQNCAPLDVASSYEGVSKTINSWDSSDAHVMGSCGVWSETSARLMTHRYRTTGRLDSIFNSCRVLTAPIDDTSQTPFEFARCAGGGWSFSTGVNRDAQFEFCSGNGLGGCDGLPKCNAQDCTAGLVIQDLFCALRPFDCYAADISADSGCVNNRGNGDVSCRWSRAVLRILYFIQRAGL